MSSVPHQLGLDISLPEARQFENFVDLDGSNGEVLSFLSALPKHRANPLFQTAHFWGKEGAGLSHLLQAACNNAAKNNLVVQYLPINLLTDYPSESICEGLEQLNLICVDDIDFPMTHAWELALFNLYNRARETGCIFISASHSSPAELDICLPDLKSRLLSGAVFKVQELNDESLMAALRDRAGERGLAMGEDVAKFILSRTQRDASAIFALLDQLDKRSIAEQRRLTIPFVREVCEMN